MQTQPQGWWLNFPLRTGYRVLDYLLLAVSVVFILDQVWSEPLLLFGVAAVAIVPLAVSLGTATEELSVHVGQRLGGLLNATRTSQRLALGELPHLSCCGQART
jgi:hypothetical protein